MIGVLGTVLLQSSSTTTSIVVSMVGSGERKQNYMILDLDGDNWASTRENLILLHASNKGTDQTAHPYSLIRPLGYKTVFLLNSTENEISTTHKN